MSSLLDPRRQAPSRSPFSSMRRRPSSPADPSPGRGCAPEAVHARAPAGGRPSHGALRADLVADGDDQGWLSPTAGGGIDGGRRCGGLPGALLPATTSPSCCSDLHAIHHSVSPLPPQPAPAQHVYRELMKLLLGIESESDTTSLGCWLWQQEAVKLLLQYNDKAGLVSRH